MTLQEVATQPLIILDRPVVSTYYRELLERECQKLNVVAAANSTEMVRSLVGAGLGRAIMNMRPIPSTPMQAMRWQACRFPVRRAV